MDLQEYSSIENNEVIDETTNVEENLNSGFDMNDVTMKLLMNRGNYDKYVVKNNPEKLLESSEFTRDLQKYKREILNITEEYVNDNSTDINSYINDSFHDYAKNIIKYLKHKEIMSENQFNEENDYQQSDDVIFTKFDDNLPRKSYWSGEQIIKKR
jgi:hypothetical protein